MKTKICGKCKKRKSICDFHKAESKRDGLFASCKGCESIRGKEYRQLNKTKINKRGKRFRQIHKLEIAAYARKQRQTIKGYLHRLFSAMKTRCTNPKVKDYKYYGRRGIKVKFKSVNEFVDYVVNILKVNPKKLTIHRIDNNGHYEPGNIRFVTKAENNRNKRKSLDQQSNNQTNDGT